MWRQCEEIKIVDVYTFFDAFIFAQINICEVWDEWGWFLIHSDYCIIVLEEKFLDKFVVPCCKDPPLNYVFLFIVNKQMDSRNMWKLLNQLGEVFLSFFLCLDVCKWDVCSDQRNSQNLCSISLLDDLLYVGGGSL